MIETIKRISKIPCINGSEFLMVNFLKDHFESRGFVVSVDCENNVFVRKANCVPQTIVFTPMDSPGFICLYKEYGKAYLSPSAKCISDIDDVENLLDYNGAVLTAERSEYDKKSFCVKSDSLSIGSALSLSAPFVITNEAVSGWYSARFGCIAVLIKLAETLENARVGFCFTSGFNSGANSETKILNRTKAQRAILLGYCKEIEQAPILILKDGKRFSSRKTVNSFKSVCNKKGILFSSRVYGKPVTSAERIFSKELKETLSLAIPCENDLSKREKISVVSLQKLFDGLSAYLTFDQ